MLKTFLRLLGDDARVFRRYVWMTVGYGLLCGLSIATLVPVLGHLLAGDVGGAAPWLAALGAGVVLGWLWRHRVERAGVRVGVAVLQGARHRLGDHVARLPVGWFTPANSARLGHVVTQGMMSVAQLPAHVFTPVIAGLVTPVVFVLVLLALQPSLGLIALVALPLLAGVLALTAKIARRVDEAFHHRFAETSQRVVEFAQAQPVLRAFGGEGGGMRELEDALARQHRSSGALIWRSAASTVLNSWAVQVVFVVLMFATVGALDGDVSGNGNALALVLALMLASRFIDALLEVVGYGEVLRGARAQLGAIRELFAVEPVQEPAHPQAPHDSSVELRDVRFRYAPAEPEVLRGLNLRVEPGSMTALVGASGAGKSTLVRLVARFFDAGQGSVRVGGVDVREMTSEQLARQLSQIFQDDYLFEGSVAHNIRVGKPDASDAELAEAVRQAGVSEIIARLPLGLETQVGEGGVRLSGGERQRIAIARALIKAAPILLVDEATAALDAENQAIIGETLARLRGSRTLIVIAHQLSTVAMADRIVVLEDGVVVEDGAPAQLLQQDGPYARFIAQRESASGWRIAPAASDRSDD